jgi:GntR family transcriptional regulator, transcriptional repressor for pyruvate dehydrogenase complex
MRVGQQTSRGNLAEQVAAKIRLRLQSDGLKPGDRLPTEAALGQEYGVSRTVVREAVASLRADGLVVARQGSGVYVAKRPAQTFGPSLLAYEPDKISSIIEMLELRAAVESEAAALAAERCSPAELAKIQECSDDIAKALREGEWAEDQDFAFHLAIAEATHNRHFVEFFTFLGQRTIPRRQLHDKASSARRTKAYLDGIQGEHQDIAEAIASRDPRRAHASMRLHLKGSQSRYQKLMDDIR